MPEMSPLILNLTSGPLCLSLGPSFLIAQLVKNLSAMQETLIQFLDQADLLEK